MTKKQEKIKVVNIGKKLMATIDGTSYPITPTKEEKEAIIKAVTSFNEFPSDNKKKKIIKLLTPKAVAKVTKALVEKKTKKRAIKNAKQELEETKKVIKSIGEGSPTIKPNERELFDKRFTVKNGQVYLKPYETVPMPKLLVDRIKAFLFDKVAIDPLINFWKLALLNPNEIARTKLFDYLSRQNLTITNNGYIVTYRMVKTTDKKTIDGKPIFTSHRTGEEDYIMGQAFRMDRGLCDEDGANDCSRGLHTGTHRFIGIMTDKKVSDNEGEGGVGDGYGKGKKWVTTKAETSDSYGTGYDRPAKDVKKEVNFDNSFGNQAVICLVNPMHVVSVPNSDTRKMRSCELYFCGTTTPEEVIDLVEKDYYLFDDQYKEFEVAELDRMLKETKLKHYIDSAARARSEARKQELEKKIEDLKKTITFNGDNFNKTLSIVDINNIIKSRIS